jgi:hypothetical protein
MDIHERIAKSAELLANIHAKLPELTKLLEEMSSDWEYEDPIYRFYHQSYKVYRLQELTRIIVAALRGIAPVGITIFCPMFEEILQAGASGKKFESAHNEQWTLHTRPIVEAFFHARFFLEMAVRYGRELDKSPSTLPSGWAALLYLYDLR